MICENCGKEFDGTICPFCGDNTLEKSEKSDKKNPKSPKKDGNFPKNKKTGNNNKTIFIISAILLVLIIVVSTVFIVVYSNDFRISKVSSVEIGTSKEDVKKIFGEPHFAKESDTIWTYYSPKYKKFLENADGGTDFEEEKAAFVHDEIRITFLYDEVYAVEMLIDYSENTKDAKKEIKKARLARDRIGRYTLYEYEIYAVVEYQDGSYRNAPVTIVKQVSSDVPGKYSVTWHDVWSDGFVTDEIVSKPSSVYLQGRLLDTDVVYTAYKVDKGYALEISGNGKISDNGRGYPWEELKGSLKYLSITEGITGIEKYAFKDYFALSVAEIPDSVTSVGYCAFDRTAWDNNQPDGAVYAGKVLYRYKGNNPDESALKIKEGTLGITEQAFYGQDNLISVEIPSGVLNVGDGAFRDCDNLKSVVIGNGVTSIGSEAFFHCGSLESINIPASVTSIGSSAFSNCGSLKSVVIPNSVTSIGDLAFWKCSSLKSVEIPDSVTSLGSGAFRECGSLKSAVIGNGVTSIGDSTFANCGGLKSVEISNSVTSIGIFAFCGCGSLERIVNGNGVTSIGYGAFSDCGSLKSVKIPDSVTSIGDEAFSNCDSLKSVEIPAGVTSIGSHAFEDCRSLVSVNIPDSVTSIGISAFHHCGSLVSVAIPNSVTNVGFYAFNGCGSLTVYAEASTKPSGWGNNWNYSSCPVVWDYKNNEVASDGYIYTVQKGIRYGLKDGAAKVVRQPSNLTEATIPTEIVYGDTTYRVTSIDSKAFSACNSLETLTVAEGNSKYFSAGNCVIETETKTLILGCKNSVIPTDGSVTSIGSYAFYGCGGLVSIVIPNSVTSIGESAFYRCDSLKSVVIGNGVTSIGESAFYGCGSLVSVVIPNGVTRIDNYAFSGCAGLVSVEIPDSVTRIGNCAFRYCDSLKSVVIGNGVTSIGESAFRGCGSLISINIPDSVTSIGEEAFKDTGIWNNAADNSVLYANQWAIGVKGALTGTLVLRADTVGICASAFDECENLKKIEISEENPFFSSQDGILYNKEKTKIIYVPNAIEGEVTIPNGITSIDRSAFSNRGSLVSVNIPDSVTRIGSYAFYHCGSLVSVEIPNSVTSIGDYAFCGCSFVSVVIPNSVTDVAGSAFSSCDSLETLTVAEGNAKYYSVENCIIETETKTLIAGCKSSVIPTDGSVTSIGSYAFYGCGSLVSVVIPDSVTRIGSSAFSNCGSLISVEIPAGVTSIGFDAFKDTGIWNNAADNSVVYADKWAVEYKGNKNSVTEITLRADTVGIGDYAFSYCPGIVSINIPDSVTSIGNEAFYHCDSLKSVVIGNGVTSIGDYAFLNCGSLESINIPDSVTSIGYGAFLDCRLRSISMPAAIAGTYGWKCDSVQSLTLTGTGEIPRYAFNGYYDNLTSLVIGNGVTGIGANAFCKFGSLTKVIIPLNVTNVGTWIFSDCPALTIYAEAAERPEGWSTDWAGQCPIVWDYKNNETAEGGAVYFIDENGIRYALKGEEAEVSEQKSTIVTANIPETVFYNGKTYRVTSIANNAFSNPFSGWRNLKSVVIPDSVTSIGDKAFYYCDSLKSVVIGNGVTSIGDYAFCGCSSLVSVVIGDDVTRIGSCAFSGCSSLESVKIPNSVKSIGKGAFYYCGSLKSVVIPNGVTSIGSDAFYGCRSLKSVEIPASVTSIGDSVFSGCNSLETLTVAEGNAKYYSIENCIIERETKTLIVGCKNSIIPTDGSVTSIGSHAFDGCGSLVSINIPDSVTSIGYRAFDGCGSLVSVVIPNSVTSIGDYAFLNCSSLESINIPDSVTSIGSSAFAYCSSLVSVAIPAGVTSIGSGAFRGCGSLVSINIPDSVTRVNRDAFEDTGIWNNAADNSVVYADKWAVGYKGNKNSVTEITLRADTVGIGDYAFYYCRSVVSINIPDSVTRVGEDVLFESGSLTKIEISDIAAWCGIEFTGSNPIAITRSLYLNGEEVVNLVIPDGVTCINALAFSGCDSLVSVKIPDSVTSIGSYAFAFCKGLKSVVIGKNVTSIDSYAFCRSNSLTNVEYEGTKAEWQAIKKESGWNEFTGDYTVKCTDGTLTQEESKITIK